MIQNNTQFYTELEEFYGKPVSRAYKDRIDKELDKVKPDLLQGVFDEATVIHTASTTLPGVGSIIKAIESISNTKNWNISRQWMLSNSCEMGVDQIIDKIKILKEKENPHYSDIDFLCDWDELYYCYSYLVEKKWPEQRIFSYLQNVKKRIIAGEKIFMETDREDEERTGMSSFQDISKNFNL
jgi:hypothetical protein